MGVGSFEVKRRILNLYPRSPFNPRQQAGRTDSGSKVPSVHGPAGFYAMKGGATAQGFGPARLMSGSRPILKGIGFQPASWQIMLAPV